jgi:peptidoglycan/LPS O-acetylase OafA/YrhL
MGLVGWMGLASWWSGALMTYPIWCAGAAIADITLWNRTNPQQGSLIVFGYAGFAVGAVLMLTVGGLLWQGLFSVCCLVVFQASGEPLTRFRIGRCLEWLGARSYSIYVAHMPILSIVCAWWIYNQATLPSAGWLAVLGMFLGLGGGLILYYAVERHFMGSRVGPIRL